MKKKEYPKEVVRVFLRIHEGEVHEWRGLLNESEKGSKERKIILGIIGSSLGKLVEKLNPEQIAMIICSSEGGDYDEGFKGFSTENPKESEEPGASGVSKYNIKPYIDCFPLGDDEASAKLLVGIMLISEIMEVFGIPED